MIPSIEFRFDFLAALLFPVSLAAIALVVKKSKKWIAALRILVYCFLVWMILEPTIAYVPRQSEKPSLAVLVDVSRSMGIQEQEERLTAVKKVLQKSDEFLQDHFELSYFQFSQTSSMTRLKDLMKTKAYGSTTNIYEGIRQIEREKKGEKPSILLFSDGANNVPDSSHADSSLEVPVYTVGVGNAEHLSDIALKELRGSDFAFKGRPVEVAVKVQNFGFLKASVPVILSEKKEKSAHVIATQQVTFNRSPGESDVVFKFVPSAPGFMEYRIEVPVQGGEIAKQNNSIDFKLEVGREKIRVLYLCGQPSPEYAFLRQVLKSDPSIELVSFVILRNPENVVPVPEEQLSLIHFPSEDIFVRTLQDFDLLIFENFSYVRFNILRAHLDNVQRFVEEHGGGFLMIGGENSFGKGGYQDTGIERILPVTINSAAETVEEEPVSIRVLEPQHPIFDSGGTLEETQKLWKAMPKLNGYHKLSSVKSGASLFAVVQESGLPAIAGWQKGKGRVLAMATLSTWQWALGLSERGLLQSGYTQFWRQIVRWLITSNDAKIIRIVLTESHPLAGRKNLIKLILQPDKFKSIPELEIQVTVSHEGRVVQTLPLTSVGRFSYRTEWAPQAEGEFTISAVVKDGARKYEDSRRVEIGGSDLELENPYPDFALLQEISERSGGEYFHIGTFSPEMLQNRIKTVEIHSLEKSQKPLWNSPWLFSLAIGLLFFEWGLRRYGGGI